MATDYERTGKLYRKIDIYYRNGSRKPFSYACSTRQWKRCKDAAQSWADIHLNGNVRDYKGKLRVRARFAD